MQEGIPRKGSYAQSVVLWLYQLRSEQLPEWLTYSGGQLSRVVEVDGATTIFHFGNEWLSEARSFSNSLLCQPGFFAGFFEVSGKNKPLRRRWFVRRI